jgi:hypothetical protein
LFADLAITARAALFFQCFDAAFQCCAESAGIFDEFVEGSSIALGSVIIGVVEGARVQIADAGNIVIKSLQAVLEGGNLLDMRVSH